MLVVASHQLATQAATVASLGLEGALGLRLQIRDPRAKADGLHIRSNSCNILINRKYIPCAFFDHELVTAAVDQ